MKKISKAEREMLDKSCTKFRKNLMSLVNDLCKAYPHDGRVDDVRAKLISLFRAAEVTAFKLSGRNMLKYKSIIKNLRAESEIPSFESLKAYDEENFDEHGKDMKYFFKLIKDEWENKNMTREVRAKWCSYLYNCLKAYIDYCIWINKNTKGSREAKP